MRVRILLAGILAAALTPGLDAIALAQAATEPPVRLKAGTFLPSRGEPALPGSLRHRALRDGERGVYLVQFTGPILPSWKDELAAEGATLLEYVPDFAFKVRMTPAQARRVRRLDSVRWVGSFHPAYRLSPRLTRNGERPYTVQLEGDADAAAAASALEAAGARVLARGPRALVVSASSGRLAALAARDDVAWIEDFVLRKKHNDAGGDSNGTTITVRK